MLKEQKIRAFLFYLSLAIFLIGLPAILSFALSYKFNTRTLRFAKAGIIALKTQPAGARVYLDGRLLNEKTPTTINELLPGEYNVTLELESFYPWAAEVNVSPGRVTSLDKIILFPLRPNVEQLNKENASYFWLDKEANAIYYVDQQEKLIYKSDLNGAHFQEIGDMPSSGAPFKKWKISPDGEKLLCFNMHQIAVVYLKPKAEDSSSRYFILDYLRRRINDIFWHSDSYHLIILTERTIEALEAKPKAQPVPLVALNKNSTSAFYDERSDGLYFLDSEKGQDERVYENVYKLELNARFSAFKELMRLRNNE